MSVYEKLTQLMANRNVDAYIDLLHEDFTVVFHKSGSSFGKEEWSSMAREMMANDKFIQESTRCVYENSEILVEVSTRRRANGFRRIDLLRLSSICFLRPLKRLFGCDSLFM